MQAVLQRQYEEAGAFARDAIALDARSARARAVLGVVLLQHASAHDPPDLLVSRRGEWELQLATQLAPKDPFVGWMHAVFLAESGHMSAAAAVAERTLESAAEAGAPASERAALLGIAGTYRYELGEERAALPHLSAYVALRPDDATAFFRLGSSLLRIAAVPQGLNAQLVAKSNALAAARAFERCFELAPGDADAGLSIATAYWRAAELAKELASDDREQLANTATSQLQQLAVRFPDLATPWFHLGVIAEAGGARTDAIAHYRAALQRDPSHVGTLLNLANALAATGDAGAADTLLREVLTLDAARSCLTNDERSRVRARIEKPAGQAPKML